MKIRAEPWIPTIQDLKVPGEVTLLEEFRYVKDLITDVVELEIFQIILLRVVPKALQS